MICKNCETENPDESVFCMHCGKRLDGKKYCPYCNALCPEEAIFCNACGARIVKEQPANENGEAQYAQPRYTATPATAPKQSSSVFEKVKSVFDLSGGICLMVAVLFALVFTLCMGVTLTAKAELSTVSKTTMLWDYFGDAYTELAELLDGLESYSEFFEAAYYLPIVLATVVGAATLVCVLVFTIIAAIKYGKHFKNPEVKYAKYAISAVFSFILGASAFLALHFASINQSTNIHIGFSGATLAGIILCAIFLWLYCASRVVMLGKEFVTKKAIVNFVCSLAGVVFMILVAAFAAAPTVSVKGLEDSGLRLNFAYLNASISVAFPDPNALKPEPYNNFIATYICSAIAQGVQIALLVLTFITLIQRVCGIGNDSKSCLGISIATFVLAVAYLVLSCVSIHFGSELFAEYGTVTFSIAAAPIVAIVFSAFVLADAITHKVLLKKFAIQ